MTPVPSSSAQKVRPTIININLYRSCRMPYALEHVKKQQVPAGEDIVMIQCYTCNRWYHHTCAGISKERMKQSSKPNAIWMCDFQGFEAELGDLFDSDDSIVTIDMRNI